MKLYVLTAVDFNQRSVLSKVFDCENKALEAGKTVAENMLNTKVSIPKPIMNEYYFNRWEFDTSSHYIVVDQIDQVIDFFEGADFLQDWYDRIMKNNAWQNLQNLQVGPGTLNPDHIKSQFVTRSPPLVMWNGEIMTELEAVSFFDKKRIPIPYFRDLSISEKLKLAQARLKTGTRKHFIFDSITYSSDGLLHLIEEYNQNVDCKNVIDEFLRTEQQIIDRVISNLNSVYYEQDAHNYSLPGGFSHDGKPLTIADIRANPDCAKVLTNQEAKALVIARIRKLPHFSYSSNTINFDQLRALEELKSNSAQAQDIINSCLDEIEYLIEPSEDFID